MDSAAISALADDMARSLQSDILDRWFPACVTEGNGFHENFNREWQPMPSPTRSLVYQARITWVAAKATQAGFPYAEIAREGCRFLRERMVDPALRTYAWRLGDGGHPKGGVQTYGLSFALYALAASASALKDGEILQAAKDLFEFLESDLRDPFNGGYRETPSAEVRCAIGVPADQKSQNTHLHLLESFTELYRAWPDPRVAQRIEELLDIVLVRLFVAPGWSHEYAHLDWSPVPGGISYGHDVETTHLAFDAMRCLGKPCPSEWHANAAALTDYSLLTGWDDLNGGFYAAGDFASGVTDTTKVWWVQAEGLLSLVELYADMREDRYGDALEKIWNWIKNHQIDSEFGGWYAGVDRQGNPVGSTAKSHAWKAAYHDGRALLFGSRILKSLVERDRG